MTIKFKKLKNSNLLAISGEMTIYSAEKMAQELFSDKQLFDKSLTVDLSAVSEIDTAGLQLLLMLKKQMGKGCEIKLVKLNETVSDVVIMLYLQKTLNVEVAA